MQFYLSEPQAAAGDRPIAVPQGRTLGGGSSVNAMIYIRGTSHDYDEWRDLGCAGWGWDDVLPVFKRAESNQRLAGPLHGTDGPLPVSDARFHHPLSYAGLRAAQEAGYPYNDDFNGATQQGVGFYQVTQRDAVRGSAAASYLRPLMGNPKLKVMTRASVGKLVTENGAAVGVTIIDGSGAATQARAREEVILTAGALATPKILMLSGIGPAQHLSALGIPAVRDLRGVGENFQDHLDAPFYIRIKDPISLLGHDRASRRRGIICNTSYSARASVLEHRRSRRLHRHHRLRPLRHPDPFHSAVAGRSAARGSAGARHQHQPGHSRSEVARHGAAAFDQSAGPDIVRSEIPLRARGPRRDSRAASRRRARSAANRRCNGSAAPKSRHSASR